MPARTQPTARQVRLGVELRKLREAAALSSGDAAGLLGVARAQMSQMEAGNVGISGERVRRLASHYACADTDLIDALVEMVTDRTRGWWEEYRGVLPPSFLDLAELEHHATYIQVIGTAHVPGLLQTEGYARAVFAYWRPELPASELEPRVEHRMRRKSALGRDGAPRTRRCCTSPCCARVSRTGVLRAPNSTKSSRSRSTPTSRCALSRSMWTASPGRVQLWCTRAGGYPRWTPFSGTPRTARLSSMPLPSSSPCEHSSVRWNRRPWSPPDRGTSSTAWRRSCKS